jgi:hypothetical protein
MVNTTLNGYSNRYGNNVVKYTITSGLTFPLESVIIRGDLRLALICRDNHNLLG